MTKQRAKRTSELLPEVRRGRLDILTIYEVSDSELDILERGSPDSLYLNFAIFLLSSAVSFTIAIFTTTPSSSVVSTIFIVFTIIGYLAGAFLALLWWRSRSSVSRCVKVIKARLPPEGTAEPLPQD